MTIIGLYERHKKKILHRCPKLHLSDHSSIVALVNTFHSFFINRISVFHSSFRSDSHSSVLNPPDTRYIIVDEVRHLVLQAPCKSSISDPIPTSLRKDCIDILITPITSIINILLSEVSFPSHLKSALVSPPLKKSLNNDNMKHYWPDRNDILVGRVSDLWSGLRGRITGHAGLGGRLLLLTPVT